MKILLCNVPIRPKPDNFPPVACSSLCNSLIKAGYEPQFYDIDAKRPSFEKLSDFFGAEQFDIVGISAVVSTSYCYVKNLASIIKKVSPKTQIVLGGNLAVSYEIILRRCPIDICVIGAGERILLNLVKHFEKYGHFQPTNKELYEIKGLAFVDSDNTCKFTGHEELIENDEIPQPDYEFLEKFSDINQYVGDPKVRYDFIYDPRFNAPHRKDKKMATIFTSKGCINRCSFCHRWTKGYRVIPVEKVIATIEYLKSRYNVGFFCISDECFGGSEKWLKEFIKLMKSLDALFQIGGARVSIVKDDPTVISRLKEVGLTSIYFGMESGSDKILNIMEKNVSVAENLLAAKICAEAGLFTAIQLVIGMPGENELTIDETIEFLKSATGDLPYRPLLSINYLQALPGTPSYEFLRYHGFLGRSVEDEEQYLLKVSDVNACECRQYVNVSEEPLTKVNLWQMKIKLSSEIHWLKRNGWRFPPSEIDEHFYPPKVIRLTSISNIKLFLWSKIITSYRLIDIMGKFFWNMLIFKSRCDLYGSIKTFKIVFGLIEEQDRSLFKVRAIPLRKTLQSYDSKVVRHN